MPEITIDTGTPDDPGQLIAEVSTPTESSHSIDIGDALGQLVPIVLFLAIALTFCVKYYFTHRNRKEMQDTVRMALERGQPLSPELLDRLGGQAPAPKRNDLRRGVVGICLGIGIGAFGMVLGDEDAVRPMLAIGLVPVLLGFAYLVLWRLSGNKA